MTKLWIAALLVASGGAVCSGILGYRQLFGPAASPLCAGVSEPGAILGAPLCIYGFFMYLTIVVVAAIALLRHRSGLRASRPRS